MNPDREEESRAGLGRDAAKDFVRARQGAGDGPHGARRLGAAVRPLQAAGSAWLPGGCCSHFASETEPPNELANKSSVKCLNGDTKR